jgi:VWFA-related protein
MAQAGGQSTQKSPSYTIQTQVSRVLVPVVVRDGHGDIVTDLKREDFRVLDDGKPRGISSFLIEKWAQGGGSGAGAPGNPNSPETAPAATERRFLVFLFDDMHLSFEDLTHARQAAERILTDTVTGGRMAAVVSISGRVTTSLTKDQTTLRKAIESLRPLNLMRSAEADCPSVDYYLADQIQNQHNETALQALKQEVFNCSPGLDRQRDQEVAERLAENAAMRALNLGRQDSLGTLATIRAVVRSMDKLPGQRTLILVSPGFLSLATESLDAESHLLDAAAESNVTISALDARGLYVGEIDASQHIAGSGQVVQLKTELHRSSMRESENIMAELADGTGGTFIHNTNDLAGGFQRLAEYPQCIYLLELPMDDVKLNGSYHRLKIRVDRKDVDIEARHGYFAPKAEKKK